MHNAVASVRNICVMLAVLAGLSGASPPAAQVEYRECTITDQHRFQEGAMSGHWGHHLGHLVRTATNGLWFADDSGNDVNETETVRYYQLTGDTTWVFRAEVNNYGTVQQNTATVAVGDTLYSYGVDISGPALVQTWLKTTTMESRSHRFKYIDPSTNYIGAAVSPQGDRIVWWTQVVYGGSPCWWNYTYWNGTTWSQVIKTPITDFVDFSYVLATFSDDSTFHVAGEALGGSINDGQTTWTYALGTGNVVLGHPMTDFEVLPGANLTACDIWFNDRTDDLHIIGNGVGGRLTYYHRHLDGTWPGRADSVGDPETIWRGTRFLDGPDGRLYLVLSTPDGLKLKSIAGDSISGPLPLDSLTTYDLPGDSGFNRVFAVFPERREYQTTPVAGLNFAYPGNDYDFSHIIHHMSLRMTDGSWVPVTGYRDVQEIRLTQNAPNPFNPSTTIRFALPEEGHVQIGIYDLTGRYVRTLIDRTVSAGNHAVRWDGRDSTGRTAASGVYIYRLTTHRGTQTRRMLLAR